MRFGSLGAILIDFHQAPSTTNPIGWNVLASSRETYTSFVPIVVDVTAQLDPSGAIVRSATHAPGSSVCSKLQPPSRDTARPSYSPASTAPVDVIAYVGSKIPTYPTAFSQNHFQLAPPLSDTSGPN